MHSELQLVVLSLSVSEIMDMDSITMMRCSLSQASRSGWIPEPCCADSLSFLVNALEACSLQLRRAVHALERSDECVRGTAHVHVQVLPTCCSTSTSHTATKGTIYFEASTLKLCDLLDDISCTWCPRLGHPSRDSMSTRVTPGLLTRTWRNVKIFVQNGRFDHMCLHCPSEWPRHFSCAPCSLILVVPGALWHPSKVF
jgi:hypothetical protein